VIEPAALLRSLVGEWTGTNRLWLDPAQPPDESPASGRVRPALGGEFVHYEYEWSMEGDLQRGIALLGHTGERYQMAWSDTFHYARSIMLLEGGPGADLQGSYAAGNGLPWGWRMTFEMQDTGQLLITSWNISPEGSRARAVETRYERRDAPGGAGSWL
jgi:hypothetical protein